MADSDKIKNIAIVGEVDASKSTFIGVISTGVLDDGRGLARASVLTCKHELESGRTSNINTVLACFARYSSTTNAKTVEDATAKLEQLNLKPQRIRFLDLAGHERYIGSTMQGLTRYRPDMAILLIAGNRDVTRMTQEHFRVCYSLRIPILIGITKIDITPAEVLKQTVKSISSLIRSIKGTKIHAYPIRNDDTLTRAITAFNMSPTQVCPIMKFSNVTGEGLDDIRTFLSQLDLAEDTDQSLQNFMEANQINTLFWTYKPYYVTGIGHIVFGINRGAAITKNTKLMLGPISNEYHEVRVRSIHNADQELINELPTGHSGCLALKFVNTTVTKQQLRKTVVTDRPISTIGIVAEVYIFSHHSTITVGYNPYIHFANAATSARIVAIHGENPIVNSTASVKKIMRTDDRGYITFNFPTTQFAYPGGLIIFREGGLRGMGRIVNLL